MKEYLKRVARFFGLIAIVPFLVGFVGAWSAGFGFFLSILVIPAATLGLLVGSIIWFVRSYQHGKRVSGSRDRFLTYSIAPLLLVVTVSAAWPLLRFGNYTGTMSRLMVNHSRYEAIIARVKADPEPAWFKDDGGIKYSVDLGPPIRVAFNPEGFLDNWSGIIYDPTGDVMLADGFDPRTGKFVAPDCVTKLFEGDLVSCLHLWGSYYNCSFT
jgi:hypothetical protein